MAKEIDVTQAADWDEQQAKENLAYLDTRGETGKIQEVLKARDETWEDHFSVAEPETFPQPAEDASDRGSQGSSYPVPAESGDGGEVPDGTVKEVLAWVGDDKSRAEAALKAEDEKEDDARISLVEALEGIVAEDDSEA